MGTPYIGEIRIMGGSGSPQGWAPCNGQLLLIASYPELFGTIGTTYGGDGIETFALPDMRGRAPISAGPVASHPGNVVSRQETYQLGQPGGEASHTLTVNEIPGHEHNMNVRSGANNNPSTTPNGTVWATPTDGSLQYISGESEAPMAADITPGPTGASGAAHENRQPYLALNFCIAVQGIVV